MIELGLVGLGIAFEEEVQRLVGDDPVGGGEFDRCRGQVPGPQHALGAEHLDALIVTVDRAPAYVVNLSPGGRYTGIKVTP